MVVKIFHKFLRRFYLSIRKTIFRAFHDSRLTVKGRCTEHQATVFKGEGEIHFKGEVILGYPLSAGALSSVGYMEARAKGASIEIGDDTYINNSFNIVADRGRIVIGEKNRIGINVTIINSDFHNLDPARRNDGSQKCADIVIGNNTFIGNNVIINKGITIGDNSVIGAGSVVIRDVPANTVYSGNPAKFIKDL